MSNVAPLAGACIEILLEVRSGYNGKVSLPSRERGLKSKGIAMQCNK